MSLPDGSSQAVSQIVFFRPGAVGDFVFALPCLATLKARYPAAHLIYIGQRWHAEFLARRPGSIDEVLVLPDCAGINAPTTDEPALDIFLERLRQRHVDLALQAFGGGRFSNPLVRRFGACWCAGFQAPGAPALDKTLPFGALQHRRLQLLELAALAGATTPVLASHLMTTDADRQEAADCLPPMPTHTHAPLLLLQPGASDPRRRWPAEHFARVADKLAEAGMTVAVHGTSEEREIVQSVISMMKYQATALTGRLSLGGLCALLERCALLISNDTGPLHLAVALGTPAVGIYWLSNLVESQPLQQSRHRAAWATLTACPVCGRDNLWQRCAHQASFVAQVSVEDVLALAHELLAS